MGRNICTHAISFTNIVEGQEQLHLWSNVLVFLTCSLLSQSSLWNCFLVCIHFYTERCISNAEYWGQKYSLLLLNDSSQSQKDIRALHPGRASTLFPLTEWLSRKVLPTIFFPVTCCVFWKLVFTSEHSH